MNHSNALKTLAFCAALAGTGTAFSHVTLAPRAATAGGDYTAAFRVSHACKDARATTGISVRLPQGFVLADAKARPGWKLDVQRPTGEVRWTAESPQAALPAQERTEFVLHGKLPPNPGPLWFKVLQTCNAVSVDWAQVPASGSSTEGLAAPAARLDVVAPGTATVDVRNAWVRQSVPGQSGTGAFMNLTAPAGARLVGITTPAAGVAEVHEMKMDGDTMRMRALPSLDLPAGRTVELKPGGLHLMLMDLKAPLPKGASIPMTLRFEDAQGVASSLELKLPVGVPDGAAAASAAAHKH